MFADFYLNGVDQNFLILTRYSEPRVPLMFFLNIANEQETFSVKIDLNDTMGLYLYTIVHWCIF